LGFYQKRVLPHLINCACGVKPVMKQRLKVVPLAAGRVLEIGVGSGLNLPHYRRDAVRQVWGLDPSAEMLALARKRAAATGLDVRFIEASATDIPLDDGSIDSVVMTYTLCSIADVLPALNEIRRVMVPDGRLIFCEHGAAPDEDVRRWQDRLNPLWVKLAGGCNLNRRIPYLLETGGFRIKGVETMYLPGWRPGTFNYWGTARPS
jgi:ubiquinone/menaquinone biosynthesis C-methylase UbiE